jgi:TolB-like protein/tetratricopeptide (TPR) repeat protein
MNSVVPRSLLHRLRERGVIRVAASYAVIAWLLLQIADVTFEPLGVPRWVMVALIVTAVIGLPVMAALAWFYEIGDSGIQRDTAPDGAVRPVVSGLRRNTDIVIILVLLAVIGALLGRQAGLDASNSGTPTIAVLPFENLDRTAQGEVLALGIAESVLHQLAGLSEIDVIARASSFAVQDSKADAVEIGRRLAARYLLGGTMQRAGEHLRVTAHLVDASSGEQLWSLRFDRPAGDIFAVQDEIAVQVTEALELSVGPSAMERMKGQGTTNLAAYLAYLQGRTLFAHARVAEVEEALGQFERAAKLDPRFAAAYVSRAEAELFVAEYGGSGERRERFEAAWRHGQELIARALELDPENGDAYLHRAHLAAFRDLAAAEQDYLRGLKLSPNAAKGYAGLAAVVYETPSRRDEALALLERARKLDPLEPGYDVTKALFLFMERADLKGSIALLLDVVKRHPQYQPALARLGDATHLAGQYASSIRYGEQALALDPSLEMTRRVVINDYLDLGDLPAARQLIEDEGLGSSPRELGVLLREGAWERAGEIAYESMAADTVMSTIETAMYVAAIRMHARVTRDFQRAQLALEQASGVRWDSAGRAILPIDGSPLRDAAIGLADVLLAGGDEARGQSLIKAILERMRYETGELGRPSFWFYRSHPIALALNGERDAALSMIEKSVDSGLGLRDWQYYFEHEPVYAALRQDARLTAAFEKVRNRIDAQRRELDRMRREGLVPDRGN